MLQSLADFPRFWRAARLTCTLAERALRRWLRDRCAGGRATWALARRFSCTARESAPSFGVAKKRARPFLYTVRTWQNEFRKVKTTQRGFVHQDLRFLEIFSRRAMIFHDVLSCLIIFHHISTKFRQKSLAISNRQHSNILKFYHSANIIRR